MMKTRTLIIGTLLISIIVTGLIWHGRRRDMLGAMHIGAYSRCGHCDTSFEFSIGHLTFYAEDRACFPLCESCWGALTIEERMPYYEQLIADWKSFDDQLPPDQRPDHEAVRQAVRDGK